MRVVGIIFLVGSLLMLSFTNQVSDSADAFCGARNKAFTVNEKVVYTVYYSVMGMYINAGTAVFSSALESINNRPVYHITGSGKTNSSYDWIYTVRDQYETYVDTATMQPLRFIRNVNEGGYKIYQHIDFNKATNKAKTTDGEFAVPSCVHDVISSIYYARNIDFSNLKVDDKVPFTLFLDNKLYSMYVRYMGKEEVKTRYGKFRALKFKPLLIKGEVFEGGEKMTIWVTDDANHVPIRIETPILVGKVKIDMMSYANLRYPLTSLIEVR